MLFYWLALSDRTDLRPLSRYFLGVPPLAAHFFRYVQHLKASHSIGEFFIFILFSVSDFCYSSIPRAPTLFVTPPSPSTFHLSPLG
jgi:hypothetical protein